MDKTLQVTTPTLDTLECLEQSTFLVQIHGEDIGRNYEIKLDSVLIGREPLCQLKLSDVHISRRHSRLEKHDGEVFVVDLDSRNGTYVNGRRVKREQLMDGDQVTVGRTIFKFMRGNNVERHYHETLRRLATIDGLTGAYNKKYFDQVIKNEFMHFKRRSQPVSLLMMDIDHFKSINDQYGHICGDHILAQLGKLVLSKVRDRDSFCRYGGEEFALVMPDTKLRGAVELGRRLCEMIAKSQFKFDDNQIAMTISIGAAEAGQQTGNPLDFVRVADELLYQAKSNGRNRVEAD